MKRGKGEISVILSAIKSLFKTKQNKKLGVISCKQCSENGKWQKQSANVPNREIV